ncbi:hypothetical protein GOBAR_DD17747 [Gossypium barbadense]|nr:hypothetical protein GOBAR_DD17747 [Gossypium barbadense]
MRQEWFNSSMRLWKNHAPKVTQNELSLSSTTSNRVNMRKLTSSIPRSKVSIDLRVVTESGMVVNCSDDGEFTTMVMFGRYLIMRVVTESGIEKDKKVMNRGDNGEVSLHKKSSGDENG